MSGSSRGHASFSPAQYFVPVLEVSGSPCYQTASQRSLPILADSQRSYRYECEYENADTGVTTARCQGMSVNTEQGGGRWRRRVWRLQRWCVDSRWRLSRGLFAAPVPLLTPYLDLKLGDVLITLPFIAMLFGYAARSALQNDVAASGGPPTIALLLTFVFVVRNNSVLLALTGISFERALVYHKLFAVATVLLAGLHGWSHVRRPHTKDRAGKHVQVVTGLLVWGALLLLLLLSLGPIRRRFFEFFVRAHWLLFVVVVVYAVVHGATLVLLGMAPWCIDLVYRIMYRARVYAHGKPTETYASEGSLKRIQRGVTSRGQVTTTKLAADMLRIQFRRERVDSGERFEYKAGQYIFVCIPAFSLLEWHPFALSSSPSEAMVTLHIKVVGDWTRRLLRFIGDESTGKKVPVDLLIDGPYGGISIDIYRPQTYSHVVLLSEGAGVLPMRSIVTWLHHEYHTQAWDFIKRVHFVWSVWNQEKLETLLNDDNLEDDAEAFFPAINSRHKPSFSDEIAERFVFDFYVTFRESVVEASALDGGNKRVHYGVEPDLQSILRDIGTGAKENTQSRVAVLVAGSKSMTVDVTATCLKLSRELKVSFDVHTERFEF